MPRKSRLAGIRARRLERRRRSGAWSMLALSNKVRSVSTRFRTLVWRKWPGSADRFFFYMHLSRCEVRALYSLFCKADSDRSGVLSVGELMQFLGMEHTDFANRTFCLVEYIRGDYISGSCDFESFVLAIWNMCTLSSTGFLDFCFELYDEDDSGFLDAGEMKRMVAEITTEQYAGSESAKLMLQDVLVEIEESHHDAMSKKHFQQFCRERPSLLGPCYHLQAQMRRKLGGDRFWANLALRRNLGYVAVDKAGQETSPFVPLRKLVRDRESENARQRQPKVALQRNHDFENARHAALKRKMARIEAATSVRSMSMSARSQLDLDSNPVMLAFARKKNVAKDMLDEMETMTEEVARTIYQVPEKYITDAQLISDMRRARSLAQETSANANSRDRVCQWMHFTENIDEALKEDSGLFAEIREKYTADRSKRAESAAAQDDAQSDGAGEFPQSEEAAQREEPKKLTFTFSSPAGGKAARKRWHKVKIRARTAHARKVADENPANFALSVDEWLTEQNSEEATNDAYESDGNDAASDASDITLEEPA